MTLMNLNELVLGTTSWNSQEEKGDTQESNEEKKKSRRMRWGFVVVSCVVRMGGGAGENLCTVG